MCVGDSCQDYRGIMANGRPDNLALMAVLDGNLHLFYCDTVISQLTGTGLIFGKVPLNAFIKNINHPEMHNRYLRLKKHRSQRKVIIARMLPTLTVLYHMLKAGEISLNIFGMCKDNRTIVFRDVVDKDPVFTDGFHTDILVAMFEQSS